MLGITIGAALAALENAQKNNELAGHGVTTLCLELAPARVYNNILKIVSQENVSKERLSRLFAINIVAWHNGAIKAPHTQDIKGLSGKYTFVGERDLFEKLIDVDPIRRINSALVL
jgi:hypothetical protein